MYVIFEEVFISPCSKFKAKDKVDNGQKYKTI